MSTRKRFPVWKAVVLPMLCGLQACSSNSALQQPPTPKLQVTPLPAEISQISTNDSQPLLHKAQVWLESLSLWSKGEMPKLAP